MEREKARYQERRNTRDWLYRAFIRQDPNVSVRRLHWAIFGHPESRERIPLAFTSAKLYVEFQRGLKDLFKVAGITDATVQVIGSAVNGWRTNPRKPLGAWTRESDLDLAVFSVQALEQAQQLDVRVNEGVILNNEYVILKNRMDGRKCFYDTPVGARLAEFAKGWSMLLSLQIDFKLNLRTERFPTGVAVVSPATQ